MRIDLYLHSTPSLERLVLSAKGNPEVLNALLKLRTDIMALLDDLQTKADATLAKATANTTTLGSIKIVVDGFVQQIVDLKAALVAAGTDPAKLAALGDTLDKLAAATDAQEIAEGALANTPSGQA